MMWFQDRLDRLHHRADTRPLTVRLLTISGFLTVQFLLHWSARPGLHLGAHSYRTQSCPCRRKWVQDKTRYTIPIHRSFHKSRYQWQLQATLRTSLGSLNYQHRPTFTNDPCSSQWAPHRQCLCKLQLHWIWSGQSLVALLHFLLPCLLIILQWWTNCSCIQHHQLIFLQCQASLFREVALQKLVTLYWKLSVTTPLMVAQEHHQVSGLMLAQWTLAHGGSQGLMNWPATCEPTLDRNHSSAVYAWGTFPAQTIWQLTSVLTLEKSHLPATHVVDDLHDLMNVVATWRSIWENKLKKRRRPEKLWLLSLMELFLLFRAGLLNPHHHHSRCQWPQWTLFKSVCHKHSSAGTVKDIAILRNS